MKILTKEEEAAHYSAVVRGGTIGGFVGLAGGLAGVALASRRYHSVRSLTLPLKAFLVTSTGTFTGIIAADHASRSFEAGRNQDIRFLEDREQRLRKAEYANLKFSDRVTAFMREEKYKIIGATWIASIVGSFVLVGRNPYLTGQQKIVQARVYAQGLTLAVLCASAAFEIHDQRKGQGLLDAARKGKQAHKATKDDSVSAATPAQPPHRERYEGEDMWKDMVAAEEQKMKDRHQSVWATEMKKEKEQKEKEKNEKSARNDKKTEGDEEGEKEEKKGKKEKK